MGSHSIHTHTFAYEQKSDCIVCASTVQTITINKTTTLNELIFILKTNPSFQLTSPSIVSSNGITLYMPKPPSLEQATRPNLDKAVSVLIDNVTEELSVTDPLLESIALTISIQYHDE